MSKKTKISQQSLQSCSLTHHPRLPTRPLLLCGVLRAARCTSYIDAPQVACTPDNFSNSPLSFKKRSMSVTPQARVPCSLTVIIGMDGGEGMEDDRDGEEGV